MVQERSKKLVVDNCQLGTCGQILDALFFTEGPQHTRESQLGAFASGPNFNRLNHLGMVPLAPPNTLRPEAKVLDPVATQDILA